MRSSVWTQQQRGCFSFKNGVPCVPLGVLSSARNVSRAIKMRMRNVGLPRDQNIVHCTIWCTSRTEKWHVPLSGFHSSAFGFLSYLYKCGLYCDPTIACWVGSVPRRRIIGAGVRDPNYACWSAFVGCRKGYCIVSSISVFCDDRRRSMVIFGSRHGCEEMVI